MRHTISVLVENQAGVLSKVAGLFARRGYNIHSLSVGVTENPDVSRITIVAECNEQILEQIEKQLNKLISVIKVKTLPEGSYVGHMLSCYKVHFKAKNRAELMRIADLMGAKIVDVTAATLTLEFTDTPERTETLESLLRPFGIVEAVRTGIVAIEKGSSATYKV